mgnify:CR=1 FL=1
MIVRDPGNSAGYCTWFLDRGDSLWTHAIFSNEKSSASYIIRLSWFVSNFCIDWRYSCPSSEADLCRKNFKRSYLVRMSNWSFIICSMISFQCDVMSMLKTVMILQSQLLGEGGIIFCYKHAPVIDVLLLDYARFLWKRYKVNDNAI